MAIPTAPHGLKGLAAALIAGGASMACMYVAIDHINAAGPLFAFPAAPLYAVGLGAGAFAGLLATIVAALGLYFVHSHEAAMMFLMIYGIPSVTLIRMALRQYKTETGVAWMEPGRLLEALCLYPCFIFLAAVALTANEPGGLYDVIQRQLTEYSTAHPNPYLAGKPELQAVGIANGSFMAPAFTSYIFIFMMLFSFLGAQYALRRAKLNLRDRFDFSQIRVSSLMIYIVAAAGLAAQFVPEPYKFVCSNLALIMGVPLFFVGLAVIHTAMLQVRNGIFVLLAFYALMFFMPTVFLLVVGLGVIDEWVDFRKRIKERTSTPG